MQLKKDMNPLIPTSYEWRESFRNEFDKLTGAMPINPLDDFKRFAKAPQ